MSAEDDKMAGWFREKFPHEFDVQEEIVKRTEEIFRTIPDKLPERNIVQVMMGIMNNPATGKLGIVMNPIAQVFLGSLGKAILDSLTAHFEVLLSSNIGEQLVEKKVKDMLEQQRTKNCSNCNTGNRVKARFCDNCGNKFE